MSDTLNYIEEYFSGDLTDSDKALFEQRCLKEQEFAREVASYISIKAEIQAREESLLKQKFNALYLTKNKLSIQYGRVLSILAIAAAACLIVFILYPTFTAKPTLQQSADIYISKHLQRISPSLAAASDSIEMAKAAYNDKQYGKAESLLIPLTNNQRLKAEALEYLGMAYLRGRKYDMALRSFEELSELTDLQENVGPFYSALTLLKRNEGNDSVRAKTFLELVVAENLIGNKEAKLWLNKLK